MEGKVAVHSAIPPNVMNKLTNDGKLQDFVQDVLMSYNKMKQQKMPRPLVSRDYYPYFNGKVSEFQRKVLNRLQEGGRATRKARKAQRKRRMTRRR